MTDPVPSAPVDSGVPVASVRRGYLTSEFWLSTVAAVVSMLYAGGIVGTGTGLDHALGLVAAGLAAAGYSVSRGKAKSTA